MTKSSKVTETPLVTKGFLEEGGIICDEMVWGLEFSSSHHVPNPKHPDHKG